MWEAGEAVDKIKYVLDLTAFDVNKTLLLQNIYQNKIKMFYDKNKIYEYKTRIINK